MDGDSLLIRGSAPLLNLVETPDIDPRLNGELLEGAGEPGLAHDPILDVSSIARKGSYPIPTLENLSNNADMEKRWHQQETLRAAADKVMLERGWGVNPRGKAMLAQEIGIAESSFITYYSGKREPGKKTLKAFAEYFQIPMADLTDDPGTPVPGVEPLVSSSMTPAKRLVLRSVAQKIGPDDVTDEQAEKVLKALDVLIEAGILTKPK